MDNTSTRALSKPRFRFRDLPWPSPVRTVHSGGDGAALGAPPPPTTHTHFVSKSEVYIIILNRHWCLFLNLKYGLSSLVCLTEWFNVSESFGCTDMRHWSILTVTDEKGVRYNKYMHDDKLSSYGEMIQSVRRFNTDWRFEQKYDYGEKPPLRRFSKRRSDTSLIVGVRTTKPETNCPETAWLAWMTQRGGTKRMRHKSTHIAP